MYFQACIDSFRSWRCSSLRAASTSPNGGGFSLPAHRSASGVGSGRGPESQQYVTTATRPKSRNTNKYNSETDNAPNSGPINSSTEGHKLEEETKTDKSDVVFNNSSLELTNDMKKLLNRCFNYSILPYKLDITQGEVDLKRFERSTVWKEFFHGQEDKESQEKSIFKITKTNFPKN